MQVLTRVQEYLAHATRRGRAKQFASRHFLGCPGHSEEATAVHALLEQLRGRALEQLVPDAAIEEVLGLPASLSLRGLEVMEVAEVVAALEREMAAEEERRPAQEAPDV